MDAFWGICEVLGHKKYAGQISEQIVAGAAFVRVDVPESPPEPAFTKLIGPGSIYGITPTSEEIARKMAASLRAQPVEVYIGRVALSAPRLPFGGG